MKIETIDDKVTKKELACDALKLAVSKNRAEQNKLLGNARSLSNEIKNSRKRDTGSRTNTSPATTTVQED